MSSKMESFLEMVQKDPALQEKLRAAIDIGKIATIANDAGVELAPSEVAAFLSSKVRPLSSGELDEMNGLDQVVGGMAPADVNCRWTCSKNSRALC
jgi:hypothetical protein